jgi:cation:H+ antiporter
MIFSLLLITVGLVLLYFGAEGLVRGSASLAYRLRVSPLTIGLTIVAFGTSMPEFVVSTQTALSGHGDISIGNIVGSNIFNIAFILGISSMIRPLKIKWQLIRIDTPIMILAAVIFWFFLGDFRLSREEGSLFFGLILLYILMNFYFGKRQKKQNSASSSISMPPTLKNVYLEIAFIIGGLAILVVGANALIKGSVELARRIGLSEAVIGLTIIAAGTSLPELATSAVAAFRKESDIAVGNVVGSNIFNILGILGFSALLAPINGPGIRPIDIYLMLGVSVALLPLMWTGFTLKRWEGVFLLLIYVSYMVYLLTH